MEGPQSCSDSIQLSYLTDKGACPEKVSAVLQAKQQVTLPWGAAAQIHFFRKDDSRIQTFSFLSSMSQMAPILAGLIPQDLSSARMTYRWISRSRGH